MELMWRVIFLCLLMTSLRAIELSQPVFEGVTFTVCKVDGRTDKLSLYLWDKEGKLYGDFDRLAKGLKRDGVTLGFAMNGGMFEATFMPVGLLISDSKQRGALNLKTGKGNFFVKPNGVFAVVDGTFKIVASEKWGAVTGAVQQATQSGPLLVQAGVINPVFTANSQSVFVRNAVGVSAASGSQGASEMDGANVAWLVISNQPVNFYRLARFMKEKLGCSDALYLDGAVSSIYAPALGRNDSRFTLGPMIGVVATGGVSEIQVTTH